MKSISRYDSGSDADRERNHGSLILEDQETCANEGRVFIHNCNSKQRQTLCCQTHVVQRRHRRSLPPVRGPKPEARLRVHPEESVRPAGVSKISRWRWQKPWAPTRMAAQCRRSCPASAAAKAGIREGDLIIALDGAPIADWNLLVYTGRVGWFFECDIGRLA